MSQNIITDGKIIFIIVYAKGMLGWN